MQIDQRNKRNTQTVNFSSNSIKSPPSLSTWAIKTMEQEKLLKSPSDIANELIKENVRTDGHWHSVTQ